MICIPGGIRNPLSLHWVLRELPLNDFPSLLASSSSSEAPSPPGSSLRPKAEPGIPPCAWLYPVTFKPYHFESIFLRQV